MTLKFPEELLSAYLDDELTPTERARVEQHLATSEADRQLLAKLKSLRSDMAALPPAAVNVDFADRVVRSPPAEAAKQTAVASLPPPGARSSPQRWMIGAAVASAAVLAVCILLVVQPWRQVDAPQLSVVPGQLATQIDTASDQFLNSLRGAIPAEGEAVVLRLRVSKDVPLADVLDAALGKAGIPVLAPNLSTRATSLVPAYLSALEAKYGRTVPGRENQALVDATVPSAQAVFIEAPLEQLERVLGELGTGLRQPLDLEPQRKLAFARSRNVEKGEGEPGSATQVAQSRAPDQPFAQRLNAESFRLEKKLEAAPAAVKQQATDLPPSPEQLVQVLILVELQ